MRKKSSRSGSWRTRTRGSRRQIGSKFQLRTTSMQGERSRLPTISGRPRGHLIVSQPERVVRLSLIKARTDELVPREKHPVNLEERAQYFMDAYKRGLTIPPILVHRLPNGKLEILDGHARVEAYRRLGVTEIPAIENGILESLGKGARAIGHAVASGARVASQYGQKALKYGERAAKYGEKVVSHVGKAAEETLSQAGRISRAYGGTVAPREELEHEERVVQIRARRPQREPVVREIVREQNVPFGGTSSPLLSQPMQEEVRRAKWRRESRRPTKWRIRRRAKERTMTNGDGKRSEGKSKEARERVKERIRNGFKTVRAWAKAPTPSIYRTRQSLEEKHEGERD
jgi:hypothetical protein